jgi:hypothetical protein
MRRHPVARHHLAREFLAMIDLAQGRSGPIERLDEVDAVWFAVA